MPHGGTESPGTARSCSKSDLDELSRQMKENIVQLKSLLGIRSKDYQIPWSERDALSLPATRSGSLIYEDHGSLLIPSKQSAFRQLSTWSLPVSDSVQMELENNMHSLSTRSTDRLPNHKGAIRDRYSTVMVRNSTQQTERDATSSSEEQTEKVCYVRKSSRDRTAKVKRTSQRNDTAKVEQAQKKALLLQRRCDLLERENERIKKAKQEKIEKIADLKHRNSELVSVARKLEEKAKALHMENYKRNSKADAMADDSLEQKKNFASILAQVQTDHEKETKERDKDIKILKNQIQDLKKALVESKALQSSMNGGKSLQAAMKQTQKESLRLQKLAAGNKKVTIRSLSMPVTARQKILEETNRSLRRQLAEYEEAGQALAGQTVDDLKSEMEAAQTRCSELEKANRESSLQIVNLESQLQIAKVETSDTNIKFNELQTSFEQLQHDYDTVHEQLAVAIHERNTAIDQYKEKAKEIALDQQTRTQGRKILEFDLDREKAQPQLKNDEDSVSSSIDKPEILEISDLQPEKQVDTVENVSNHSQERQDISVPDDKNDSSEAEEVSEEIIISPMDESRDKLKVFIAKYTYDPYIRPNDCPETELQLIAGDYVYVYGSMDEDGFYEGELENGMRGLVPSNFLEPVDEDHHASYAEDDNHTNSLFHRRKGLQEQFEEYSGVTASHSALLRDALPYPQNLRIDKKLLHSLIISWSAPLMNSEESVSEYIILVNGKFKMAINGKKKLSAVVQDIDHNQPSRLEVCAMTRFGISDENLCSVTHGKGTSLAPNGIHMEKIGSSTARVAWTSASSQHDHIVNVIEEGCPLLPSMIPARTTHSVPSPAYRLTLENLKPNMKYTVSVSLKDPNEDNSESRTSFTTPESGPPEPPIGVQIEECSNKHYLLVTWLPVTLNTLGTSNGVVVSGYSIHVAGLKIHEVHTATLDQCTIRAQSLADAIHHYITETLSKYYNSEKMDVKHLCFEPSVCIRTHAVNGQVSDFSDPCRIPKLLHQKLESFQTLDKQPVQKTKPCANNKVMNASMESTDIEVSFSSDASMPGFQNVNDSHSNVSNKALSSSKYKTDIFKQTRIVPSIEITQDSSSEDEHTIENVRKKPHKISWVTSCPEISVADTSTSTIGMDGQNFNGVHEKGQIYSSENSHFEDSIHFSSLNYKNIYNMNDREKIVKSGNRTTDHNQKPYKYHEDLRAAGKRPTSVASDEQSTGSHMSQSSSRHGPNTKGKARHKSRVKRQSTMSSQSGSELTSEVESSYPANGNRNKLSLYVAGYTYDPKTMSPNVDSYEEELGFVQGQLVKVIGDKDEDGFYFGETNTGDQGYVPCNLVYPVITNGNDIDDLLKRGYLPSASPDEDEQNTSRPQITVKTAPKVKEGIDDHTKQDKRIFKAQYDYDPQQYSPNIDPDTELTFKCGDIITVYGDMDSDGFYQGELSGKSGLVPSNFVDEIPKKHVETSRVNHDTEKNDIKTSIQSLEIEASPRENLASNDTSRRVDRSDLGSQSSSIDQLASKKKSGIISKGKKLFKKLGGSQDGRKR